MSHASTPRRRWRRTALAPAGVSRNAAVAPMIGANPAAAVNAPLTTTDGLGVRIDENAILGPALELIEDAMQPYVNQKIYEGALANSVMDDPDWVQGSANLELSFDFVNAGVSGYPQGGLKVHADLQNIMMRFYRYGEWWQPECQFRVNPDNGYIDASAKVNAALLPAAPLQMNPITAYWDEDPAITREKGNWLCTGYLIDEWWDGLWGSGTTVAQQLEAELNGEAQDLINDLWNDHVTPIVNTLSSFGVTFNQIRTDDHGLIVTANINASNGVVVPGVAFNFPVGDTPDSGATSNVNTLLANRGEIIASIHPNVVAQYLNAIDQMLGGQYGGGNINGPQIEALLLNPADRALYADNGWFLDLNSFAKPAVTPTGTGGAPLVGMSSIQLVISHNSDPFDPVAIFEGSFSGIKLVTEVRPSSSLWGPAYDANTATLGSWTRTYANVHASAVAAQSASAMAPIARISAERFSDNVFVPSLSLAPISIGGLNVSLCTACGRYSGDQRYTETFNVA